MGTSGSEGGPGKRAGSNPATAPRPDPYFHHRLVRSRGLNGKKQVTFLARWPSDRAMRHARDRVREITGRRRLPLPPEVIAREMNMFLRGWAAYCVSRGHARSVWKAVGSMI